jgi:hypothetical protein
LVARTTPTFQSKLKSGNQRWTAEKV